ncbi:MAG: hypothetical protein DI599_00630 [Pseudomonas kuykendallii]|uniref:Uncharacterized protein n=1 Tax=Pseudomonas kuykendallii TaxID=1007099 RepID=A0A2W5D859_9PSED|nr:MAG: hypothetical protein DI599_00630 [Pseudomonas kuykendallii]
MQDQGKDWSCSKDDLGQASEGPVLTVLELQMLRCYRQMQLRDQCTLLRIAEALAAGLIE